MVEARLDLFGGFRLVAAGSELRLPTRKAEALLACLALSPGRARSRETLIGLLWGERAEAQARHSLSQTLSSIRRALTDLGAAPLIVADADSVSLESDRVEVDVERFERLAAEGTPCALAEAAALYQGDLLEGLRLREEAFEDWLAAERSRLRELAVGALATLLERHAAAGRTDDAIQAAVRLLALDPLQEAVHRHLMRLYVAQGRAASALRQYELCARTLRRELDVEPEAETTALHDEIARMRNARARRGGEPPPASAAGATARGHGHHAGQRFGAGPAAALATGRVAAVRTVETAPAPAPDAMPPFGRDAELQYLRRCLDQARAGTRRIVFVAGEAGLGKTTLVETFLDRSRASDAALRIGHGQCLEHRGPGEAYMPVLEALGRLCRGPHSEELVGLLARHAPSWLAQMPWLRETTGAARRAAPEATQERMLREMVEAVEAMTAETPLVLVLEDLHWSDPSTIDLLARLVRRSEPARLLVIGTYRPAEVGASSRHLHAIVQELCARGYCDVLALGFLGQAAVAQYLSARFPGAALEDELARLVHERTDGNPLFMAGLANAWIAEGLLVREDGGWSRWAGPEELAAGVPGTLRQLIEQQLERLEIEDQELLEAASVVGMEFSAVAVAAGVGRDEEHVEMCCVALARRGHFLHGRGTAEWPDGTVASRFGFIHDLYQEVLYDRVPAGRRARLHRRIGTRLEAGYGARARERAAELAVHFVRGRDFDRAVRYLELAADQALQRSAHREVIGHLEAALNALRHLPDDADRARRELSLQTRLGEMLTATQGWASIEAERAFHRARELCRQLETAPELSRVLYGLASLYEFRGEFTTSQALIEERLHLLTDPGEIAPFLESQELLSCSLYHRGRFAPALVEADRGLARYGADASPASPVAGEMAVHLHAWAAMAHWFLGRPEQALARAVEVRELGRNLGFPAALAAAHAKGAVVHQLRRDAATAEAWATTALQISTEYGFRYRAATASIFRGWALAVQGHTGEGLSLLRRGLAACRESGAEMDRPHYLALLAEACARAGRIAEGLDAVAEGLAIVQRARGGQPFFYEAELHRLDGVLRLEKGGQKAVEEAEARLRRALEVARLQESSSLELRAALDLARARGDNGHARDLLDEVLGGFEEGFETPDLIEARSLLDDRR